MAATRTRLAPLCSVAPANTFLMKLSAPSTTPFACSLLPARTTDAIAVEAFARALRQLPTIICENGGYDAAEIVTNLRAEINNGNKDAGINMFEGKVDNMVTLGVTECLRVKEQALVSATEAAEMILRVDDIVRCAPRQRQQQ